MDHTRWLRVDFCKFASTLRQLFQEYIHELPNVLKTVAMWALSLLQVVLICHYSAPTLESRKWRNRLQFLKINPSMYRFPFFQSQCAVYVRLPCHHPDSPQYGYTQHGHFYVGSTAVSLAKRDFNRQAKFKQLCNGQAVHVELSLRYWSPSGNFHIYNTIVLETHTTYEHAWVREHCLISHWQPALNHPYPPVHPQVFNVEIRRMEVPVQIQLHPSGQTRLTIISTAETTFEDRRKCS